MHDYFDKYKFSDEELEFRKKFISGSDMNRLATGDENIIYSLWEEKTGRSENKDLTDIFPVMMGLVTEPLNLAWISRKYGYEIDLYQKVLTSEKHKFMRCTLDGAIMNYDDQIAVIDAKYTDGRPKADESWSDVIPRLLKTYTPQINWNAYLLSQHLGKTVRKGVLSIIRSGNEPILEEITIDPQYQRELIDIATYFHGCVELDTPPEDIVTSEPPIPPELRKPYDMASNEDFKHFALNFIQTKGAAVANKEYEAKLKKLVPKDALNCFGHGINIKVAKNFRKTIEIIEETK